MKKVTKSFRFEGKRYYVRAETETEAEVKKALKLKELKEGSYVITNSITFEQWAEEALNTYRTRSSEDSLERDKCVLRANIMPHLGKLKLSQIRQINCQKALNAMSGKADFTITRARQLMELIFTQAVNNNLIAKSPMTGIVQPKGHTTERRALTPHEEEIFLQVCQNTNRFDIFLLMYYCGCRPEEARKAMRKDISIIDGYPILKINGTKSKNAVRNVPMPEELFQRFKHKQPFEFLVVNNANKKVDIPTYRRMWNGLKREMNIAMGCRVFRRELLPPFPLSDELVPYCLRHTYCTNLCKKKVDIRTAQYLMGHSSIELTSNIYTHIDNETVLNAAAILNGSGQKVQPACNH